MDLQEITVRRDDLGVTQQVTKSLTPPARGQVLVEIETIGLTANNISYASAGDMLGYWSLFSTSTEWGVVPVWGVGVVSESHCPDIALGERLFGIMPMASHVVLTPDSVSDLCFSDTTTGRTGLHPWYNRYYRCGNDPAYREGGADIQTVLWPLFMTGWMLADELAGTVDCVYISSASSKTAIAAAWAMKQRTGLTTVGLTSATNRAFVENLEVYSRVVTYDNLAMDPSVARAAYVDIAGNAKVTSAAHVALGDALKDSILIGGTHRAPAAEPLPMPGPAPRFFFIPAVADTRAAEIGLETYHQQFAEDWQQFAGWAPDWLSLLPGNGMAAIEAGYQACLAGDNSPHEALVYRWQ